MPPTDWSQVLGLIASGMATAQRSVLEAEVKKRELDRRIEEQEKKLAALAPARVEQTEVKVFVVAAAPLEADLTVRYQVRNAAWVPRYDARLTTGTKTAMPRLDLTRRAEIKQRTGESWDNVAVQLSTTRPTANAAAPSWIASSSTSSPRRSPRSPWISGWIWTAPRRWRACAADSGAARKRWRPRRRHPRQPPAPSVEIGETTATVKAAPFQAVFGVASRLTVPATGEPKRVLLQQDAVEPVLTVRAVPKVDAKAYLYAKLVLPKGSPLLPGTVSLFRDGTFVGVGDLPVLSPGEDHELGFGADDQVRVRHAVVDEKRGETGLSPRRAPTAATSASP